METHELTLLSQEEVYDLEILQKFGVKALMSDLCVLTGEIEDEIENEENEQEDEVENEDVATQNNQENANNKKEDGHDGLVYVEGFGYVKDSGPAQGKTVHSDGDINKMVGTMD